MIDILCERLGLINDVNIAEYDLSKVATVVTVAVMFLISVQLMVI